MKPKTFGLFLFIIFLLCSCSSSRKILISKLKKDKVVLKIEKLESENCENRFEFSIKNNSLKSIEINDLNSNFNQIYIKAPSYVSEYGIKHVGITEGMGLWGLGQSCNKNLSPFIKKSWKYCLDDNIERLLKNENYRKGEYEFSWKIRICLKNNEGFRFETDPFLRMKK